MRLILLLLLTTSAWAGTDYGVGVSARTYPLGAMFSGTIGQSFRLWSRDPMPGEEDGAKPTSSGAPWRYGFVRGSLTAQTIALVSRISTEVEFYPISIFGIAAGTGASWRSGGADAVFDCQSVQCGGVLWKSWLRAQAVGAAGPVFFGTGARLDWFLADRGHTGFVEESSNLLGSGSADQLFSTWLMTGVHFGSGWDSMAWVTYNRFLQTGALSFSSSLAVKKSFQALPLSIMGGGGTFESSHQGLGPVFFLQLQWTGMPSPVLL